MGKVQEFVAAEPPNEEDFVVIHPKLGVEVYPNSKGKLSSRTSVTRTVTKMI